MISFATVPALPAPATRVHRTRPFLSGSYARHEAEMLLVVGDRENQYLTELNAERTSMRSNSGRSGRTPRTPRPYRSPSRARLRRGCTSATIEQHHFAGCRRVQDVTLKVPLHCARGRWAQARHHPAYARIETLGDALDHPPLPAASRPSKRITTWCFVVATQSLQLHGSPAGAATR